MAKIVVLGSNGQLGSDLMQVLADEHELITSTKANVDAASANVTAQLEPYASADYIINCIATTNVDG